MKATLFTLAVAFAAAGVSVPVFARDALPQATQQVLALKDGSTLYVFRDGKMARDPTKTVQIRKLDNLIGGDTPDLGNTIVASTTDGLWLTDGSQVNTIINNAIGVLTPAPAPRAIQQNMGASAAGNGGHGIKVFGQDVTGNKILNNVIGNNAGNGIDVSGPTAPGIGSLGPRRSRARSAGVGLGLQISGNSLGVALGLTQSGLT